MPRESVRDAKTVGKLAMVGWYEGSVQVGSINSNVQATISLEYDAGGNPRYSTVPRRSTAGGSTSTVTASTG